MIDRNRPLLAAVLAAPVLGVGALVGTAMLLKGVSAGGKWMYVANYSAKLVLLWLVYGFDTDMRRRRFIRWKSRRDARRKAGLTE